MEKKGIENRFSWLWFIQMRFSSYLFPLGYTSFMNKTKECILFTSWNIPIQGFKMCVYVLLVFVLFDKVISYVKTGFWCEIVRFKLLIFFLLRPGNRCAHTILTAFVRDLRCKKNPIDLSIVRWFLTSLINAGTLFSNTVDIHNFYLLQGSHNRLTLIFFFMKV